jgi:hypothetical protein
MFSTSPQIFSLIDDVDKKISLSNKTNFKIEAKTLDTWIFPNTYPSGMKHFPHLESFMIYKIQKLHIKKRSNKGDMTKKLNVTHNLQKFITFINTSFSFEILRIKALYNLLQSFQI